MILVNVFILLWKTLIFSGKFVVKIAGIYSTTVNVFSPRRSLSHTAKLGIYVNRASSGGEEKLCDAHSVKGEKFFQKHIHY